MDKIEKLAQELDAKYPGWDLYRTAMKEWCVSVEADAQKFSSTGASLLAGLEEVFAWNPLPLVPRMPRVYYEGELVPYKVGSNWRVKKGSQDFGVQFKTKRAATAWVAKVVIETAEARAKWIEEYGWTGSQVEGVDFRFKG